MPQPFDADLPELHDLDDFSRALADDMVANRPRYAPAPREPPPGPAADPEPQSPEFLCGG